MYAMVMKGYTEFDKLILTRRIEINLDAKFAECSFVINSHNNYQVMKGPT